MRDGVLAARRNIPAVSLVTTEFVPQGDFVARSVGMPTIPRATLPHPVAGTGHESMERIAQEMAPVVVAALAGR